MLKRFVDWIIEYGTASKRKKLKVEFILFALMMIPLVGLFAFGYITTKERLTELTLSRREALAALAATMLEEKFDRVVDVGKSFATRVQFRKLIAEGKWDDAIKILEQAPSDFAYIDNVVLFDTAGVIKALTPITPALREVIGQSFAHRDYYKGVSKDWQPYVSEVFKRAAEPKYNVVALAVPIRSEFVQGEEQKILGILLFTIRLDTLLDWSREIEVGTGGFVYFVDRNGHAAGHPKYSATGDVIDFSEVPAVKKVLAGERGVEILYNQVEGEERISAFEPIPKYGWGVIVQQPTATAFVSRDQALRDTVITYALIVAFIIIISYFTVLHLGDAIFEYRQRQKIFLESIGDGIVAIDRQWRIILWSNAATSLTGWTREEALGKPFREVVKFVRERDRKENIAFIEEAMITGEIHFMENSTLLIRKDGTETNVGDSASPIFDQDKQISGAIVIFRDTTKEHEVQRAHEEFNSLASHQLRAPVTTVKGYTEMLLDEKVGTLNEEQKKYLMEVFQAGQNMNDLVNAMLDVSRIELGTLAINPEAFYIPDSAEEVLKDLSPKIQEKEILVEKIFAKDLPTINVDTKLTKVIFENLLSNAVKYTIQRGKITVEISKKDRGILIRVTNTGFGIPEKDQMKIFTRFFRASNVSSQTAEGTGLGLYIVKSVLDQAGGKIWFESRENKDTSFFVSIPLEGMKRKEGMKGLS